MLLKPEIFSDEWYADDFIIPFNKEERAALRLLLEGESRMGRMFTEGAEQHRAILLDRIKVIGEVDAPASKSRSLFRSNQFFLAVPRPEKGAVGAQEGVSEMITKSFRVRPLFIFDGARINE